MKKLLGFILLIISCFALASCGVSKTRYIDYDDVREVILEEENEQVAYYIDKYDLANTTKDVVYIDEKLYKPISKTSSEEYSLDFHLKLYVNQMSFDLSYDVINTANEVLFSTSFNVRIEMVEDELCLVTDKEQIRVIDILKKNDINNCDQLCYCDGSDLNPLNDLFFGGGGAGCGGSVIGAIVGAAVVTAIGINSANNKGADVFVNQSSGSTEVRPISPTGDSSTGFTPDEGKAAGKALKECPKDIPWTKEKLKENLGDLDKYGDKAETQEKVRNEKKKKLVYLGRYNDGDTKNYVNQGSGDIKSEYFSCTQEKWDELKNSLMSSVSQSVRDLYSYTNYKGESVLKDDIMWPLNVYFLELCIRRDCDFMLVDNPDFYYNGIFKLPYGGPYSSYSRELEYIHTRGYSWIGGSNMVKATRGGSCITA